MKDKAAIKKMIEELKTLKTDDMYLNDFFLTWNESDDEIAAVDRKSTRLNSSH